MSTAYSKSSLDLLTELKDEIKSDSAMPNMDKKAALGQVEQLSELLWKYSD